MGFLKLNAQSLVYWEPMVYGSSTYVEAFVPDTKKSHFVSSE